MKLQLNHTFSFFAPLKNAAKLATGLSLAVGLLSGGLPSYAAGSTAAKQLQSAGKSTQVAAASLPNGVYLYGQSAQPEQIGQAYFVFEVNQGKVLGALYMPRSSFDCAYGTFQPNEVALTVIDSYEKTRHPYAIALEKSTSVATRGNPALSQISLEGFQRIHKMSENDQRILSVCKQNYPSSLK